MDDKMILESNIPDTSTLHLNYYLRGPCLELVIDREAYSKTVGCQIKILFEITCTFGEGQYQLEEKKYKRWNYSS